MTIKMTRMRGPLLLLAVVLLSSCALAPYEPTPEERMARQVIFTVPNEPPARNHAFGDSSPASEPTFSVSRSNLGAIIGNILSLHQLKLVSQWSINALGLKAIVAEVKGGQQVERAMRSLQQDSRVESVERVKGYDLLTYNDPYFHMQTASVRGADIEQIHGFATGRDVSVALIDTGVDRSHPELAGNIVVARNFVDHDARSFDDDEHGTSVAGVISSAANNELGIVGVAPNAKLMVLKACWQDSQTRHARCDSYSIIKALVEVLKLQPDVVNLSLSGPADPLITQLLKEAHDRGIIVVAAVDAGRPDSFPASLDHVLAVAAVAPGAHSWKKDAILAPGIDVLTTAPGATYAFRSGSSMATAYVSGVAALLRERQPLLGTTELVAHLRATARHRMNALPVVDICEAVSNLVQEAACPTDALAGTLPE